MTASKPQSPAPANRKLSDARRARLAAAALMVLAVGGAVMGYGARAQSGSGPAGGPASAPAPAPQFTAQPDSAASFQAYLASLWPKAQAMGISRATFDRIVPTLTFNPRVVQLDRNQLDEVRINPNAPVPRYAPYRARHIDQARINNGKAVLAAEREHLERITAATGVPAEIILGIYGNETNYGRITGNFDLLRSLSTLAYEGRRRDLFEAEFLSALVMVERGAPREALVGSWAGAFGYPQFLPSVYLRLARDGDGDGVAAIWNNQADALASIAHYLEVAGYKRGERWGYAVSVPDGMDRVAVSPVTVSPRCPRVFQRHSRWMTAGEWRALGISFRNATPADTQLLALIEPDGQGETAYLITGSYRAILDYNCSNFYGLTVGLLGDAVVS